MSADRRRPPRALNSIPRHELEGTVRHLERKGDLRTDQEKHLLHAITRELELRTRHPEASREPTFRPAT